MPTLQPMLRTPLSLLALLVAGCSISPLQGRIEVGEEPFVVFVAEASDGRTDLFASLPGGGEVSRLTFTLLTEEGPRLTPQGGLVVFLRARSELEPDARDVIVMNLLSGAERRLELPDEAGQPLAVAWSGDRMAVYARTTTGTWRIAAPPATEEPHPVAPAELPVADSALAELLGTPRFARAAACEEGGVCVTGPSGEPRQLSAAGRDPFRWGRDSLAWFEAGTIVIRPLGPGPERRMEWSDDRVRSPRQGSYAEGQADR